MRGHLGVCHRPRVALLVCPDVHLTVGGLVDPPVEYRLGSIEFSASESVRELNTVGRIDDIVVRLPPLDIDVFDHIPQMRESSLSESGMSSS